MAGAYAVRTVLFQSGERLPLLFDLATGIPLFEPTLFAVAELRARGRASATIEHAMRAVMVLQRFLDSRGIDLDARLTQGRLMQLGEVDELAGFCRLPLEAMDADGDVAFLAANEKPRITSKERVRMRISSAKPEIDPGSAAIRLAYIRSYIQWLATDRLLRMAPESSTHSVLRTEMEIAVRLLTDRIPSSRNWDYAEAREGLSPEARARLEQVIDPSSVDNPWVGAHVRERNALMVHWLLSLGLRRGELLGLRIPEINFQANEVRITRHADDPTDPRVKQPNTKTRGRLLPLDGDLAALTRNYVLGTRRTLEGARKHDFLFVANGTGAPLTLSALNKIFDALRRKSPDLPRELTPHVLRHTWNDRFSEIMDERRVSEETEKKMRSRLMGWSETSNTSSIYTRRHVQRKARVASLELQKSSRREKPK